MAELTPRSLLADREAHPLVLDFLLLKKLGYEWYGWEPETVWTEVARATKAPNISEANRNKVQAMLTVHKTDTSFQRWEVFEKIVMALNGVVPRFDVMQKPDLGQLVLGVGIVLKIRVEPFSDEVARYVAAALLTDGVVWAPEPLRFANPHLRRLAGPLHDTVAEAVKTGNPGDDEAVPVQLARIREAVVYSAEASRRLLSQLKVVVDEPDPARSLQ